MVVIKAIKGAWWLATAPIYAGVAVYELGKVVHKNLPSKEDDGLAKWKHLKRNKGGMLLGYFDKKEVRAGIENSVLMFARRGKGKTQTGKAIINTLQERPDLIIADDHGDVEIGTRETLEKRGYRILRIDIGRPRESDGYNPLSFLRPYAEVGFEEEVERLCLSLIADRGGETETGRHFNSMARGVVVSVILAEAHKHEKSLSDIAELLISNETRRTALFNKLADHPNPIVRSGVRGLDVAGKKDEKGGIETTLIRELKHWLLGSVKEVTGRGELDFDQMFLDRQPYCIYIRTGGDADSAGAAIVRVIMGNAIYSAKRFYNQTRHLPTQGKLPKGLLLIGDEPENLGDCAAFITLIKELRKVGCNIFLPFQSLAALKRTYKEWHVVYTNCIKVISSDGSDTPLYEDISKLAGEKVVMMKASNSQGESEHETLRPVLTPSDIQQMAYEKLVYVSDVIGIIDKPFERR